jgi:DNA-directed RNA polymerase specialized sigma subunit
MTIEEIYYSEDISVRSFNVCNDNDLKDLNAILKHYREHKTFGNLRNCGKKSNEELTDLCMKYIDYGGSQIVEPSKPEKELITAISSFNRTQREIVNSFIEINSNNLSNRSKNAITSFLNGNLKIRNISERILTNDRFNFQDIKNVGTKTVTELKSFIHTITEFIEKVAEVDSENDLVALRNRFFIEKTFSISYVPNEILESQSIFSLVDFLISKNAIFEKNESVIFQKAFKIFDNQQELTLDEIAEEINISRERVRQIRKGILDNLFNKLQFVKNIEEDLYQKYGIDQNQNLINIDDDLNIQINEVNNTNFSIEFNTFIICSYISDKFVLVGEIEDVLLPKYFNSRDRHNWDNFYLVKNNVSSFFNFIDFANDLDNRLSDRIEESYNFNFKSYLLSFFSSNNLNELDIASVVAENILNNEFGIYIDTDDNIRFNRNSQKQAYEYTYEALKLLGKPSKVNEITRKIEEMFPDYETNDAKVRASLKRQNGFVPIGRRSIFGLKEWEKELENFKGGTIRQIVAEYLNNNSSPQNYSDITSYVLQFRPKTNEYSIIQNIKLDESKTFIFFKNSFVGLLSKTYDKTFVSMTNSETIEKKSWEERYTELTEFLALNNRLPFSSGCPENEIKLYRWYKIQVGKTKNGIEEEKSNLINELIKTFEKGESTLRTSTNNIGRRKRVSSNSKYKYEDLTEFISINKRMPDSRDPNESSLYQFYNRNKKNLGNIDVLSVEEVKLVELIEKFGSSKHPKYTIDELMEFIKINKRMPDSRTTNERGLYQFAYKQRKLFEEGDLDQLEVNKFDEIAKIIQNHKYENKRN